MAPGGSFSKGGGTIFNDTLSVVIYLSLRDNFIAYFLVSQYDKALETLETYLRTSPSLIEKHLRLPTTLDAP